MVKQTAYSTAFKSSFVNDFKNSKCKTITKFIVNHPIYYKVKPNTAQLWIKQDFSKDSENNVEIFRKRKRSHEEVESRLVKYIKFRQQRVVIDKCGLSWNLLLRKAHDFHEQISGGNDVPFVGATGWLSSVLKRNNLKSLKLHGEGGEVSPQKAEELMTAFRFNLQNLMEENDITIDRVYNADQTGLFYAKLPNTVYCDREAIKDKDNPVRGVKAMKDKDRLTLMVQL